MNHDRGDVEAVSRALPVGIALVLALGRTDGMRPQGRDGCWILCPSHSERTASCSVTAGPRGGTRCNCFPCGWKGDEFDLIAACHGRDAKSKRDFPEVLRIAADLAGVYLEDRKPGAPRPAPRPPAPPPPPPEPVLPHTLDAETFHALVVPMLHVGALDVDSDIARDVCVALTERHMLALAQRAGLAAHPVPSCQGSWIRLLVDEYGLEAVARSGLVSVSDDAARVRRAEHRVQLDGSEYAVDLRSFTWSECRLIIPWRTEAGLVQTVQRRLVGRASASRTPKYTTATRRPVMQPYGVHKLAAAPADAPIAIVEGALDALALEALLAARGVPAVVLGIPGAQGWRPEWAALCAGRAVATATDPDDAGERAALQIERDVAAAGATRVDRWRPGGGAHDWAEQWAAEQQQEGRAA